MKKRFLSLFLAVLMALLPALPVSAAEATANVTIFGTEDYDEIHQVLQLVNQARTAEGLNPLTLDNTLTACAMQRAAECAVYFDHIRPNGTYCFTLMPGSFNGENIAAGQSDAASVHTGWMNSPGHRENVMRSSYRSIGIGCFYQNERKYWVQLFSTWNSTDICQTYGTVQQESIPISVAQNKLFPSASCLDNCSSPSLYQGTTIPVSASLRNTGSPIAPNVYLSGGYTLTPVSGGLTVSASTEIPGATNVTATSLGTARLKLTLDGGTETVTDVTVVSRPILSLTANSYGIPVLNWEDTLDAARLFIKEGSDGPWTQVTYQDDTDYVHYNYSENTSYTYVLRALAMGKYVDVSEQLVTGRPQPPAVPDLPADPSAPGNLDGNNYINEDDAIYLLQYVLMPDQFPVEQDVDFDGNGAVNEDDAIYLLQHILMPDQFPL